MDGPTLLAEVLSGKSFSMYEVIRVPSISCSRLFRKQQRSKTAVKRVANIRDKIEKPLLAFKCSEKQSKETCPPYSWYKRIRGRLPSNLI